MQCYNVAIFNANLSIMIRVYYVSIVKIAALASFGTIHRSAIALHGTQTVKEDSHLYNWSAYFRSYRNSFSSCYFVRSCQSSFPSNLGIVQIRVVLDTRRTSSQHLRFWWPIFIHRKTISFFCQQFAFLSDNFFSSGPLFLIFPLQNIYFEATKIINPVVVAHIWTFVRHFF